MIDILGISFSNSALHVAHHSQENSAIHLASLEMIPYPFDFNYDHLFNADNIASLAQLLLELKNKKKIKKALLHVSLPINYVLLKKIALPLEAGEDIVADQVEWELSHYLPGQLSDFKVIKTNSAFSYSDYEEVLFVCLHKQIIQGINQIAQLSQSQLKKLIVDNFALEDYLQNNVDLSQSQNQMVFKIESLQMISHFFIRGRYYISYVNNIFPLKNYQYEDKLIKLLKDHHTSIENLIQQMSLSENNGLALYAYGDALSDDLINLVQQNISGTLSRLPSTNYPGFDVNTIGKSIEAVGACII
jgi:Tfp pilus assembly PilM family ATPase